MAETAVLAAPPGALAPCHCDPLAENFLDTGARMWIVDWEYSGMNDPMWDLGDLSVEGGFDQAAWIDRTGFAMLRTEEVANVVVVRYLPRVTRVRSAISNTIRPRHASRHCHASGTDEARYLPDVLGADPQLWRHSMNNSNHRYNLRRFTPTGMHGVSIRR